MRTLDLGHNALTAVPDLSALTQLEILYLHENALTALPALPPSLTYLNISENPLRDVELGSLPNLIELRMLDLDLDAFPDVAPLPALRELHLRRNRFKSVPEAVRGMRELRLLDLRANGLTSVPEWIAELPRLEKLDLRWNEVFEPPRELVERGCVVLCE
ncbi:leucine-rich repeat domain-containing protein [Solirubrobacter ginsenosidimutans]|uniref:Leucine-rich repeat domain-containing protein n=1 Tax=Solirubrobacter ginsenosidimutans TaxID=490573 RepID=A0A9X3N8P7_9ACTN|nr:leucine-rich repeat domain-containing protein [Solirubrobacter ginsenosidimutans]MDA0166898.1 leucine-rich repeat domain-containing protein [Solirubrobacter ginsenosidimutans]